MKQCDCLNTCGDDPALEKQPELSCDNRKAEQQRAIEKSHQHKQLIEDAARYRFLRSCDWFDSAICVVAFPKKSVKLGSDCPSGVRLDEIIDSLRGEA